MEREIKFRAWDKLQIIFLKPWPDGFHILGETTCFNIIGQQLKQFTPDKSTLERLNDVIITQYTGLKDKNNNEIYEDDIVKSNKDVLFRIIWSEKKHGWCAVTKNIWNLKGRIYKSMNFVLEKCVVIGNIYENPEHLNQ
jgi:uncharacterized phage protein (TIGR01671 family)